MSFKLYKDQQKAVNKSVKILKKSDWVYLAIECQIGKTHISLAVAEELKSKSVLVVTLKTVVTGRGFEDDYEVQGNTFDLATINYESAHKVLDLEFDTLIIDEAHSMGAFPKMTKRAEVLRKLKSKAKKVILLSATPTPESYSQWFHQIIGIESPLSHFKSFYKFKNEWVNVKEVKISASRTVADYSDCKPEINKLLKPNVISMTYDYAMFSRWVNRELTEEVATLKYDRRFALADLGKPFRLNENECYSFNGKKIKKRKKGFPLTESKVEDCILKVKTMKEVVPGPFTIIKKVRVKDGEDRIEEEEVDELPLHRIEKILKRDKCIYIGDSLVTIDSPVSMLNKASQLSSGVIIDDDKQTHILSEAKIRGAMDKFNDGRRLAIFYIYVGEKELIKSVLGDDVTDDLSKFQSGEVKHFTCHFTTGSTGIRLSDADELLMINVPHSYVKFYQSRQRRSALLKEGKDLRVWWVFSTHGIEQKIFDVVNDKKDFTISHYKKL